MRTALALSLAGIASAALAAQTQEKREPAGRPVYKVEFHIRDAAAAKSARRYTILMDPEGKGSFRVGHRIPFATGSFQPGAAGQGVSPLVSTQYQYFDTGVGIECRLRPMEGRIVLSADFDISTVVEHPKGAALNPPNPTISSVRVSVNAIVNPGKPTQIVSIDDPVTERKFDVEATVTKVD